MIFYGLRDDNASLRTPAGFWSKIFDIPEDVIRTMSPCINYLPSSTPDLLVVRVCGFQTKAICKGIARMTGILYSIPRDTPVQQSHGHDLFESISLIASWYGSITTQNRRHAQLSVPVFSSCHLLSV